MKYVYILILLLSKVVVWGQPVSDRLFDTQLETLASYFSDLAREDSGFNQFVKTETGKRFDGDFNFLLKPALQLVLPDGQSLRQKIMQAGESGLEMLQFIESNPQLQLAVPIHWEDWNGQSKLPICWMESGYDEATSYTVPCLFADGSQGNLSALIAPAFPVCVLSLNERTDASGILLPDYRTGEGGGGIDDDDDDKEDDTPPCYGGDGDWQYLESIYCINLNAIEHWIAGAPEIQFIFKRADNQSLINGQWGAIIEPPHRNDIDQTWYDVDATLFRWYQQTTNGITGIGSFCFVFVNERDNGTLINLPISVTVATPGGASVQIDLTVTITDKDETIGTLPVYFEDCNHFVYNPGTVKFKMYRE
ncbi:MAG: hypothetical protein KDC34_07190 [Saprospiraceae bacterium]|nr:hypothetical protein [Saprospiraceae bacterium]